MATSLSKVTASSFGEGVADVNYQAVDQANGNEFVNTGKTLLLVNNNSGGDVNPTFTVGPNKYTLNNQITKTPNGPVSASDSGLYGFFPTAMYGTTVTVNWDTGTSIEAAVVELEDTPI